ncbi:unnamed protein product [Closterium sp. Naga37s-1]|nr:unnamed protein product [Closterium sp. Naga37s-1]
MPYRASLPCLAPLLAVAPVAARGCHIARSATNDKAVMGLSAILSLSHSSLISFISYLIHLFSHSFSHSSRPSFISFFLLSHSHTISLEQAKTVVVGEGGMNPWSEWCMRVWKKPVLRVGDSLVFK